MTQPPASNDDVLDRDGEEARATAVVPAGAAGAVALGRRAVHNAVEWIQAGDEDPVAIQPSVRLGLVIIIGFFVILGGWAAFAPLNSAVVAPGQVIVENRRRTIEHLEGGIVDVVHVREGARVKAGDLLLRLRDSKSTAERDILESRQAALLALRARLQAEIADSSRIAFPPALLARSGDPDVREAIDGQIKVFSTNRTAISEQVKILRAQVSQGEEQIGGLRRQIAATAEQSRLIAVETADVIELYEKGYERKSRVNALKRAAAQLDGQSGSLAADVQRTRQANAERQQRIASIRADFVTKAANDLRQTEEDLYSVNQQLGAAQDRSGRLDLRAPVDGHVVGLQVNSRGDVVTPAKPLMSVVPDRESLVVEARLKPTDVDNVVAGMSARVLLTGIPNASSRTLDGTLTLVSADALQDQQTGLGYYLARVTVEPAGLARLPIRQLVPGMPAEVMITTRKRTVLQYIFEPLYQAIEHSGTEE